MNDPLDQLQSRLSLRFHDRTLLECAVTHPSLLPAKPAAGESNQRLEFLGDAVLQLVLTEELYRLFPGEREGRLSKRRAVLTKGAALAGIAREIGLDACLRLSPGEEASGGRRRATTLEDACEALVGAIYLDAGLPAARRVILALYGPLAGRLAGAVEADNPKGRLQELVQPRHGNDAVRYDVTKTTGQDHAREYEVTVSVNNRPLSSGRGSSKKLAEEQAAQAALDVLQAEGWPS